jgi:hypothetical protein
MSDPLPDMRDAIVEAVLNTPGNLPAPLRLAIWQRVAGRMETMDDVPVMLADFVDKTAQHAFKVVDRDIEHLRDAGYSEEAIYEVIVTIAAAAGIRRIERGLDAMAATTAAATTETES